MGLNFEQRLLSNEREKASNEEPKVPKLHCFTLKYFHFNVLDFFEILELPSIRQGIS
jgi:hypothetical protein